MQFAGRKMARAKVTGRREEKLVKEAEGGEHIILAVLL